MLAKPRFEEERRMQSAGAREPGEEAAASVVVPAEVMYVQQSREEMEVLLTLLAERYERGSVMLTSNLPFSKWEQIFKDATTSAAAIDRLVHHSIILELNVPSYRLEKAKRTDGATNQQPSKVEK